MTEATHTTAQPAAAARLPLCVDLDGTLLKVDSLHETAVEAVRRDWRVVFSLPGWLAAGRPELKRRLAEVAPVDAASLPHNEPLLAWLRAERQAGRSLVLATASNSRTAEAIAAHLHSSTA